MRLEGREETFQKISHHRKAVPPKTLDPLSEGNQGNNNDPPITPLENSVRMDTVTWKQEQIPTRISGQFIHTKSRGKRHQVP